MNLSIQKFDNQDSLEQFLNQMKLQIFNKEFAELCKVSQEAIAEALNKDSQGVQKVKFIVKLSFSLTVFV